MAPPWPQTRAPKRSSRVPSAGMSFWPSWRSEPYDTNPSTSRGEMPASSQAATMARRHSFISGSGALPRL